MIYEIAKPKRSRFEKMAKARFGFENYEDYFAKPLPDRPGLILITKKGTIAKIVLKNGKTTLEPTEPNDIAHLIDLGFAVVKHVG